ncbi:MAG: hypothetical protein HY862_04650 [Chloroflexi bacterium]|nr:hypothetical protein [Chloroflexota bacterium]
MLTATFKSHLKRTLQSDVYVGIYRWLHHIRKLHQPLATQSDYLKTFIDVFGISRSKNPTARSEILMLSLVNTGLFAKFDGLLAKAFALKGFNPTVICSRDQKTARYIRLFGVKNIVYWDDLVAKYAAPENELEAAVKNLVPRKLTPQEIKEMFFHEVAVGRHALSWTLRRLFLGHPDLNNPQVWDLFVEQLKVDVQAVLVMENWLREYSPAILIMRDPGYVPNGAIYETSLRHGVDTIEYAIGQKTGTFVFKRYSLEERWTRYLSISRITWEKIRDEPWTPEKDQALQTEFEGRYHPDSKLDIRFIQTGKKLKSTDEVIQQLGLDPNKKTAVVFSHVAFDAAFFSGQDLFEDLEDWFIQTAQAACQNPNLNWILKLHPGNLAKVGFAKGFEEPELIKLRLIDPLPDHVKILRANTDINTRSLHPLIDYGLTVRGTIGFELPCLGIPTVIAGTGYYSGYGFTIDAQTREGYLNILARLDTIPPLNDEQILLAKKHAYCLFVERQTPVDNVLEFKFTPVRTHHFLSQNVRLKVRSAKELMTLPSMDGLLHWVTESTSPDLIVRPSEDTKIQ